MRLRLERWSSQLSTLLLVTDDVGVVRALDYAGHEARMRRLLHLHYGDCKLEERPAPASIKDALTAYFAGEINALVRVPTATGGTAFQRDVWAALRLISSGTTISYAQLAANVGRPGASRAVGAANGANPIAIVVPCHRVVGATGALTGYAGGMAHKRWLLDHERRSSCVA
jgi:methylated-DNA-[protein]-cysteine S-methyltransferase